ncbi:Methylmalonate-semialdehyde dehydrogenase (CoA acylating) [Abeliophyllum distichum]|uniref:methylmalonate-semialdehyde dehydrogenase (CoA acylating) n=1 Tax=Abeliophyllum distichum TaxID=126358 RepID=A0ABD1V1U4_9LAMI
MELPCQSEISGQNLMPPPQPGTFQDREDLIKYVRDFGASQGYVVTIKKSKRDRRVLLGCDRGGVYRNRRKIEESKRKRKVSSRLINCPFEAVGKKDEDDVWVLTIKNGEHNHEPLKDMSEHPYSRRFTEEEVWQIKLMTEAGIKPRQVLKALKQTNPDLQSTPRHLYNVKAKIRQGNLSDKSFKSWRPSLSVPVNPSIETSTRIFPVTNYIGGKFVESQACEIIDVINPATQEVISQVPMTTYEEFKAAVSAAKQAFPAWKNTAAPTRRRIMFKLEELIRRDIDKIAMNIAAEQGKTLYGAKSDLLYGLEVVEQTCGMATLQMGEYLPNAANGVDAFCIREPLGVCAGICPSSFPSMIPLWMFPIAVTCGNTFILKSSEQNPGATMMIAALAAEAGLPDGVLNIIHGNREIVDNICDDDDIKAISSFSSNTARMHIYARAAAKGKCIQSNMGVKNHVVVMPDASADATLDALIASGFGASRVQKECELVQRAKALKVNAGTEAGVDIGPVISKESKNRICRLVQSGVESGARLVLDGRHVVVPRYENGNFLGPTIMCNVTANMDCYKEDMLGPVLLCMQAESLEEAIAIVNRSKHGNGASIFTSSGVFARKFQNEVENRLVGINVPVPLTLPFSMFGSEASFASDINFCGKAGVQFFTQIKSVVRQWKELPRRRVSLPYPPPSETEISSQETAMARPPAYESDVHGCETSPAMPPSSNELPSHDVSLPFLPTAEDELANPEAFFSISSTAERELSSREASIIMPPETAMAARDRGVSTSVPPTTERIISTQTSRLGETTLALRQSQNMSSDEGTYRALTSQRISKFSPPVHSMDINVAASPMSERLYIPITCSDEGVSPMPLRNESMGIMSFGHDMQRTDSDRIYMPLFSQQNENIVPTSEGPEVTMHSNPDSIYLSNSHGNDDMGLISLRMGASVHQLPRSLCMSSSYKIDSLPPQTPNTVHTTSDMYLPSAVQRNDRTASTSESIFIPATSQGMYIQTPIITMDEYRGQAVSRTLPTSQEKTG